MTYIPFKMRPCFKDYLWGGTRLKREFGKGDAPEKTAESWELAALPDGASTVAEGQYAGLDIETMAREDRDGFWGTDCRGDRFPLLVKLIDAKQCLSIQVHPSDLTARRECGESGKAEMWYVVDCEPQAYLYLGFSRKISQEEFLRRAQDGTICDVLNRVPVSMGDVFYILPGTIHAIGAGVLIAEIQQSSNTTFRVYDYQRRDADGNLRPLHLERAAQVLSYTPIVPEECKANSTVYFPEFQMSEMFSCRYFRAYRIDVQDSVTMNCDGRSFQHVLCVEGEGHIVFMGTKYPLGRGDSYLLPAALGNYQIRGVCRVLLSRV